MGSIGHTKERGVPVGRMWNIIFSRCFEKVRAAWFVKNRMFLHISIAASFFGFSWKILALALAIWGRIYHEVLPFDPTYTKWGGTSNRLWQEARQGMPTVPLYMWGLMNDCVSSARNPKNRQLNIQLHFSWHISQTSTYNDRSEYRRQLLAAWFGGFSRIESVGRRGLVIFVHLFVIEVHQKCFEQMFWAHEFFIFEHSVPVITFDNL